MTQTLYSTVVNLTARQRRAVQGETCRNEATGNPDCGGWAGLTLIGR